MGNYKEGSDIDLAISGEKVNTQTVSKLHARLNEELPIPYFIDVLDYKALSNKALIEHIEREGKEFYLRRTKFKPS